MWCFIILIPDLCPLSYFYLSIFFRIRKSEFVLSIAVLCENDDDSETPAVDNGYLGYRTFVSNFRISLIRISCDLLLPIRIILNLLLDDCW